jgi:hypothetical protein
MKTSEILVVATLSVALLVGCSRDDEATNAPVAVRFTSAIAQSSPTARATGTTWAMNDNIGVFMVNAGSTTIAEGADNKKYTTTDGSNFSAAGADIFFPVYGSNVDFIAYYPYTTSVTGWSLYDVIIGNQSMQENLDLLYSKDATGKNKNTIGNVALTFKHQLSKVILNTTVGIGLTDLSTMSVTIKGMDTRATFNLATGALTTTSTIADITPLTILAGSKYEAIVLPATFSAAGAVTIEFALSDEVFTWKSPADLVLEAGKQYIYDMTITRTSVSVTCTITDWNNENRNGTATD